MSKSKKVAGVVAGIAAVGLLGAYAFAQQGHEGGHGRMGMGPGHMKGMGQGGMGQGHGPRMGNVGDPSSRLSSLKSELGIKPEQAAAWDAYAKIVTDTATQRREYAQNVDRDAMRKLSPAERQQHFTAMQAQRDAVQATIKAAAEKLLATLDDAQKAKAQSSLPGLVTADHGSRFGMMGGPGGGRGMGPTGPR